MVIPSPGHIVIFTDLDGTLLDLMSRSADPALPVLEQLRQRKTPVIFCSAKTRAEQESIRQELKITDPFIVENGGAAYIPRGYFPFPVPCHRTTAQYNIHEFGMPYREIRTRLLRIREALGMEFRGFGDLTAREVTLHTGLNPAEAVRAADREYDETLLLDHLPEAERRMLFRAIREAGLRWTHGGRFYHVMGENDKGRAVQWLLGLFERFAGEIYSVALGDSRNDLEMLRAVDLPVLVEKYAGGWEDVRLPNLRKISGKGPVGWRRAVESLVL